MPIDLLSGVFMGGVALLACADLAATLAASAPAPRARPSPERRCPFCHQGLERDVARARCAACSTAHHSTCWDDHGGCSIFGCGSLVRAGRPEVDVLPEAAAPAPTPEAASAPVPVAPEAPPVATAVTPEAAPPATLEAHAAPAADAPVPDWATGRSGRPLAVAAAPGG